MSIHSLTHAFFLTVDGVDPSSAGLTATRLSVEPQVVDQFDMRGKSQTELAECVDYAAFRIRYRSAPTPGEIGCALAHRHCWSTLVREGGEAALVFEDDAMLQQTETDFVTNVLETVPSWDLINLHITSGVFSRRVLKLPSGLDAYRATIACFGAYAYLITRAAACRFLNRQTPVIRNYADWPDEIWNMRAWGIKGGPVVLNQRPSTLGRIPNVVEMTPSETAIHAVRAGWFRARRAYRLRILGDLIF